MLHFGLRVLEEREARGFTQEQLAERVGLGRRQMQRIETGKVNVKLAVILELSDALGIAPTKFFSAPSPSTVRRPGRPTKRSR
jgi:transcriptional regulator with XRE-family HTH domain